MDSFTSTFKPKYSFGQKVGFLFMPLLTVGGVYAAITSGKDDPLLYLFSVMFLALCILLPFTVVRQIRFSHNVAVDRFIVPPREFEYSDIVDVGQMSIKTKRGNLSLYGMKNIDELKEMLATALAHADTPPNQIEGKLARQEANAWTASTFAWIAAIPITVALAFLNPPWLQIAGELTFLIVYLVVFVIVHFLVKRLSQRN